MTQQFNQFIIEESDIFKHLIQREELDNEQVSSNVRWFLNRVTLNIFEDEYYILYTVLEKLKTIDAVLSYEVLAQILMNNIEVLLESPQVKLYQDEDMSELERGENIINHVLEHFEFLEELELDQNLRASVEFYIDTYCEMEYEKIIRRQQLILATGYEVGREVYRGIEGAKRYYDKAHRIIDTLKNADDRKISDYIDTGEHSYEDTEDLMEEEESGGVVTSTGVEEMDNLYEMRKGEIVTIQAGTGVGKTRGTIGMLCYNAVAKHKKTVLYMTFEQKSTRVLPLFYARHVAEKFGTLSGVDDKTIRQHTYPIEHKPTVESAKQDFVENSEYGRLRIEGLSISADEVRGTLERIWEEGLHFDMVVIDYIGLIETEDRYTDISEVMNMLNAECKSFKGEGFLGVVVNQLSKAGEEAMNKAEDPAELNSLSKLAGSESQYIVRGSDLVFTLFQSIQMKTVNKLYVIPSKVRDGDSSIPYHEVFADLGTCLYFDYPQ